MICFTHSIQWATRPPAGLRLVLVGRWAETVEGVCGTPNALECSFFLHPSLLSGVQCQSSSASEYLHSQCWEGNTGIHVWALTEVSTTFNQRSNVSFSQGSHAVLRVEWDVQDFGASLDALLTSCAYHLPCYSVWETSISHVKPWIYQKHFCSILRNNRVLPMYLIKRMRTYWSVIGSSYKHL